jgi:hypothetical protein
MHRLIIAVCVLLATLGSGISLANAADKPCIKAAGYDYDRVRGVMDGKVGIEGADVSFHYEDIYAVNNYAKLEGMSDPSTLSLIE